MNRRRIIGVSIAVVALVIAVLALAACGSDKKKDSGDDFKVDPLPAGMNEKQRVAAERLVKYIEATRAKDIAGICATTVLLDPDGRLPRGAKLKRSIAACPGKLKKNPESMPNPSAAGLYRLTKPKFDGRLADFRVEYGINKRTGHGTVTLETTMVRLDGQWWIAYMPD